MATASSPYFAVQWILNVSHREFVTGHADEMPKMILVVQEIFRP